MTKMTNVRAGVIAAGLGVVIALGAFAATTDEIILAVFDSSQDALRVVGPSGSGVIDGSGTTNTIAKFTAAGTIGDSPLTAGPSSVTSAVPVLVPDGTVTNPGLAFKDEPELGFFRQAAQIVGFGGGGGGGSRFRLSGTNGTVGLGSTAQVGWAASSALAGATALDTVLSRVSAGIVRVTRGFQFPEGVDLSAPAANNAIIYARDDGAGKTELVARFPTGAIQVIATEP